MFVSHLKTKDKGVNPFKDDNLLNTDPRFRRLKELQEREKETVKAISLAMKRCALTGAGPNDLEYQRLQSELTTLQALVEEEFRGIQEEFGIPEELLEYLEKPELPPSDDRYWRTQVEQTPSSANLDDILPMALQELLSLQEPEWLKSEAKKQFRLGLGFTSNPLHLVNGTRLTDPMSRNQPQRFAQMLLVSQDHLNKREDLDFFAAAELVPEVASLGSCLDEIKQLGPHAVAKFKHLPMMSDGEVCSTVYEFLVGAACLRKGLPIAMLEPDRSSKTPDFTIRNWIVPAAIECKRRNGLTEYERNEARFVETLYQTIQPWLLEQGLHVSIEAEFSTEVGQISPQLFGQAAIDLLRSREEGVHKEQSWGRLRYERLPYTDEFPTTRIFSPAYLQRVFDWPPVQTQWDGLLCEVDPPDRILVQKARNPRCLKWVSLSSTAILKKSRGITSLWADAVRQIPDGEVGFVYIAYTEGSRTELADARTRYIIEKCREWNHRWSVLMSLVIVNRLYPRAIGPGMPDLIESGVQIVAVGDEHFLTKFPTLVFV